MNSLYDPDAIGQTYEALGPDRFTMVIFFLRYVLQKKVQWL